MPCYEDLLVTYRNDIIYVVNPTIITITSIVNDLRRCSLCMYADVAYTKDEIFILEGKRNVLRIAYYPESYNLILGEYKIKCNSCYILYLYKI